ncbi:MAG: thioredoxin family protein [Nitrososphaeria archaeon]
MFDFIKSTFDGGNLREEGMVIVVFYTTYCPFCVKFEVILKEHLPKIGYNILKADITDDDNPLWDKYSIKAVPTLIAFKNGKTVARKDSSLGVGLNEEDLRSFLFSIVDH